MKYVRLGNSGLQVSRLALGCMSYGTPDTGQHSWTLGEDDARPFIRTAVEAGINFFDTANSYSGGTSEEILGRALKEYAKRENVVIATKVFGRVRPGPNGSGSSRKAIMTEVDASLRRLGTDYIDLYQIHRWDPRTPIEETLETLNDLVRSGKVRYLGASSMFAWQFSKALYTADLHGWTRFISMQPHYNLLNREEEREMLPLCEDQGIGVLPWSPLARGRLTRPWDTTSVRAESDEFGKSLYGDDDKPIVDVVGRIADERGVERAQVALAWVLSRSAVTAPIVGATKPKHLADALAALELELTDEEYAALESPYRPRPVVGFA
ncbi:aldo/keto reductase [Rhodococcus chondri]|uniref:Aldo/keto reductase n=1 Tax=Rhodococcus chondri TaxID=3065941 RepID=A0ABU7JMN2_9NOCA|nr:aldo/keto reductase [Rhodococcus sp. CC-R104]MEE2031295.1 aldo/keto reductase [Rhodococcus sp. CC-R104]